ncbi:uncharacterized protein BCR38DRAFT_78006 [Pseudomassariella vexata]|uniref:Uncharacterized protein n=1 Tax=Pseudomassariella vexata TaxID=1141098 RepID=A0A1Y2DFY8_9PEZI|nr:uncharacterized protein BCR38DRAFT_78006 [Pseudomassariella vexata]ORY58191.1 hypothetical protein BCR38DRAFT_78006 [Pseudomassariella vexata]
MANEATPISVSKCLTPRKLSSHFTTSTPSGVSYHEIPPREGGVWSGFVCCKVPGCWHQDNNQPVSATIVNRPCLLLGTIGRHLPSEGAFRTARADVPDSLAGSSSTRDNESRLKLGKPGSEWSCDATHRDQQRESIGGRDQTAELVHHEEAIQKHFKSDVWMFPRRKNE